MGKGIGGRTPLWRKRLPVEVAGSMPPLIAAGVTATGLYLKPDLGLAIASSIGFAWLLGASGWKIWQAKRQDAEADSYEGVSAALLVLHATVCHLCSITENRSQHLRGTVHRVVFPASGKPTEIEQLVDYVGGKHDGASRKFPIHCGVTGLSVRERSPLAATLVNDDPDALLRELIRDWGYTEDQAKGLQSGRPSVMAVPILAGDDGQEALGVVYLDSDLKDLFTTEVQDAIVAACSGLTKFIHRRYK